MTTVREMASPAWHELETFARTHILRIPPELLEDEVAELLGPAKSERRAPPDAPTGSRNGHGRPWHSPTEAKVAIFRYLEGRYNPHRRHSALGQQSPINSERVMSAAP